jgi:phosphopantetheine adenylyltransferase
MVMVIRVIKVAVIVIRVVRIVSVSRIIRVIRVSRDWNYKTFRQAHHLKSRIIAETLGLNTKAAKITVITTT